jgi:hypothetical protein
MAGSFWFRFYKQKTEKPEPNRIKKPEKTEPNQKNLAKPSHTEKTEPNRVELVFFQKTKPNQNRSILTGFGSVVVFFKKIQFGYFFFYKNQTEPKMITSTHKSYKRNLTRKTCSC